MCLTCRRTFPKASFPEDDLDFCGCFDCRLKQIERDPKEEDDATRCRRIKLQEQMSPKQKRGDSKEKGYATRCRQIRLEEKLKSIPNRDASLVRTLHTKMHQQNQGFTKIPDVLNQNECKEVLKWMMGSKSKKVQIGITEGDNR